jgi:quercetin dioxygenase-like cupin family protein
MTKQCLTRRDFNRGSIVSLIAAATATSRAEDIDQSASSKAPSRREVIKQQLPGEPPRQLTLVEVLYPPGMGSPPHIHPNGVLAFVVSGAVASRVHAKTERVFHMGETWWEPPGAVHRVSRNASKSREARLLAIYIAPIDAKDEDLMRRL